MRTKRGSISQQTSTPLNDKERLGDIRNTHSEQKVLLELSQHIENDFNPEHKTETGKLELVRLIHRNLTPNNSIMLAMNKDKPPATTPREFFTNFLGSGLHIVLSGILPTI